MEIKNIANSRGGSTDSCGFLLVVGPMKLNYLFLFEKKRLKIKFLNHKRGIYCSPIFCKLSIIVLRSSVSNAEDKSSSINC